jgi:hypothetical protein
MDEYGWDEIGKDRDGWMDEWMDKWNEMGFEMKIIDRMI